MKLLLAIVLFGIGAIATAQDEQPLGRNYRKHYSSLLSNAHLNSGKIPSESKVTATSLRPGTLSGLTTADHLKSSASDNKETFSIGLGVLSPSYSQKFGEDGKTKLDFNSDQGGFSYSLTNVVHPSQQGPGSHVQVSATTAPASKVQSEGFVPSSYYNTPQQPQVNIYHKQSADPAAIYGRQISNQYPAAPTIAAPVAPTAAAPAAPTTAGQAAAYAAAQQAAFGYNPYNTPVAAAGQTAPAALANFPSFAASLTDAEKSFLQTTPQVQAPGAQAQLAAQTAAAYPGAAAYPAAAPSPYATAASPYATAGSPYAAAASPYAAAASPYAAAGSPYAAAFGYQQPPAQAQAQAQAAYQQAATSTQPKLVSQQQLTANMNPTSIMHAPPLAPQAPGAAGLDPYLNQYMAAASMYNPAYGNLATSASSAYPSMSPYDFMNEFGMY